MAFRTVVREPEVFEIDWGERFTVLPWTADKTEEIAQFLLGTGSKSFARIKECADGRPESARHYVTRALGHMKGKPDAELGYSASSLVYDSSTGRLVAICLCCATSVYTIEVHPDYQRQGLATNMLKRALSVCAQQGAKDFHLWRCDDTAEAKVYDALGFRWTDETE